MVVTTGDADGIGWEVSAKALAQLGPRPGAQFIVYRDAGSRSRPAFPRVFRRRTVSSMAEALATPFDPRVLVEIRSARAPARWVEEAITACLDGGCAGLITAPLSKTSIIAAGLGDIGHTEILARMTGAPHLHMGFVGRKFAVVLATGHRALRTALADFDEPALERALAAARELRQSLPPARAARPIAVVGVNPHAGEAGLIGDEETWSARVIARHPDVVGPLVPDAAFLPHNWGRYSVYVTPYHDQGLIPFKLVHGFRGGVHLTLGLPFVRSSVDHGTAKDVFGLDRADPGSMKDAITTALRLTKENSV